jgi:hypothetical protein
MLNVMTIKNNNVDNVENGATRIYNEANVGSGAREEKASSADRSHPSFAFS